MATWEMQLLSRIVRSGDLKSVVSWGIGVDDFLTSEGRGYFDFITGYYTSANTNGAILGPQALNQILPNFILCDDPSMTVEALCFQVRQQRLNIQVKDEIGRGLAFLDQDPVVAATKIQNSMLDLVNLGYGKTTDIRAAIGADTVFKRYMAKAEGVDLSCGRWPWDIIDRESGGFTEDDYIVFFGRPKSFKSWILVHIIASLITQGKRILVYTKEMTWEQMYERIICGLAQVPHWDLRQGKLHEDQFMLFRNVVAMLQTPEISNQLIILSGMDTNGGDTPAWVRSKIDHYKPNFVFIDGLHLMADAKQARKREERITNISRDIRAMVIQTKIPVIATVQANRAAAKNNDANLDEIAYSDALGQDATTIIRTIKDKPDETNPQSTVSLVIGAMRNGTLNGFRIHADPATNFTFHSHLTAYDAAVLKDQDDNQPNGKANGHGKPMTESKALGLAESRVKRELPKDNRFPVT